MVAIRHGRMLASELAFFRGGALLMAADLASMPTVGLTTQISGDAHLSNFGAYATPERRMTFDVNDFDETLRGPWEWDLKRLVASLAVAGRNNGFSLAQRQSIVTAGVAEYREAMTSFAGMRTIDGEETVKTHVSNILSKLHLADRTQAAIYGLQRRLIPLDDALEAQ